MGKKIFVAGASGVVGRRLCRLLVEDGWLVTGSTRSQDKASMLRDLGVNPVVVDVFDEALLNRVVSEIQPDMVVHQLTDLPSALDPARMPEAVIRNARIREVGTRNLLAAAVAAGVKRVVAQSIAFAYSPGPLPYDEDSPLNTNSTDRAGVTARGVASLEQQVLRAPLQGIVLRYGKFYGPGTGFDHAPIGGAVHVDAAADAARRALILGAKGIYNIAETDGTISSVKAANELGWESGFRIEESQQHSHTAHQYD
jgi:nucleoside-diphosphate-sugar epimerase